MKTKVTEDTTDIYTQFRNDITFGRFKPGEHLPEKFLTETYKVSRSKIREVIGQLASQGYLTFKPNRGAQVTRLSLEDVDVVYNILMRCESYAAECFCRLHDEKKIRALELLNEKMKSEHAKAEYRCWLDLNNEFHEVIFQNCGSAILADLIFHTRLRIFRFRAVLTTPEMIALHNEMHSRIIAAIRSRDAEQVGQLVMQHLENARESRLNILKHFRDILS